MRILKMILLIVFIISIAVYIYPQDDKDNKPKVSEEMQKKIDKAIEEGAKFLLDKHKPGDRYGIMAPGKGQMSLSYDEIVVYTLIHAGISKEDPKFKAIFDVMVKNNLANTYSVSLHVMALEAYDKDTYKNRLIECAQFLIDNQCKNGQWSYGEPIKPLDEKDMKKINTPNKGTGVLFDTQLRRRGWGPDVGDNSNSQYAALGLRACLDSGIKIPRETLELAASWWEKNQNSDGGWAYCHGGQTGAPSHGSMATGGLGALVIYKFWLQRLYNSGIGYKENSHVKNGLKWLGDNFTVSTNPNYKTPPDTDKAKYFKWLYYYLYALERAGVLYGTEKFGSHEWYIEGAKYLLNEQKQDGHWAEKEDQAQQTIVDTCWAILFLKRATKPLKVFTDK